MIRATSSGSFDRTMSFLLKLQSKAIYDVLDRGGQKGVNALRNATKFKSGRTRYSWRYKVYQERNKVGVYWYNLYEEDGVNIAVILQYGHGTGTGGYVEGIDYINPALRPVFDEILADVWREVRYA